MDWTGVLGQVVIGFYGGDAGKEPRHMGVMVGYMSDPTVVLETPEGQQIHWSANLCRPATRDEEVSYWKCQAERWKEVAQQTTRAREDTDLIRGHLNAT